MNPSAKMSPLSPLEGICYRVSPTRCRFSDTYEAKRLPGIPFRKSFKRDILRGYLQNANFWIYTPSHKVNIQSIMLASKYTRISAPTRFR
jgi:hypothetical protein